jgi:hypothetical protein
MRWLLELWRDLRRMTPEQRAQLREGLAAQRRAKP